MLKTWSRDSVLISGVFDLFESFSITIMIYKQYQRVLIRNSFLKLLINIIKTLFMVGNIIFLVSNKNLLISQIIWPNLKFSSINYKDYSCGVSNECENENIDQGRSYMDKNIDIYSCYFSRYFSFSGNGGVICIYGSSYSMNINSSMFYNCVCSDNGGAIYFISSNSSLKMICANSCSSGAYGHFAYLQASQSNQVEYLSVSNCSNTTSGYYSILLDSGNQRVDNTNSSMNNALLGSGVNIDSPSSFTSSCCTFSNNKVLGGICISFYSSYGTISMLFANVVHNNSPSNYGVVQAYGAGSRNMLYCIFHSNQNSLFSVREGSLEVSHSFIYHSGSFSTSVSVLTSINNTYTNRNTYQLQFFNSHYCKTDILPVLRSPDQTLMRSLGETIRQTIENTMRMTHERTLIISPRDTQIPSPYVTLLNTFDQTIMDSLIETPVLTLDQTIKSTPRETHKQSQYETPFNSFDQANEKTLGKTIMETISPTDSLSQNSAIIAIGSSAATLTITFLALSIFKKINSSKIEQGFESNDDS